MIFGSSIGVGVVGPGRLLNLALTEKVGESLLQGFEMASDSGPDHDAVGIDRPSVPIGSDGKRNREVRSSIAVILISYLKTIRQTVRDGSVYASHP